MKIVFSLKVLFLLVWPILGLTLLNKITPPHYVFQNLMFSLVVTAISLMVALTQLPALQKKGDELAAGTALFVFLVLGGFQIFERFREQIDQDGIFIASVYFLLPIYPPLHYFLFLRKKQVSA
jgi:hypothetical protein